VARVGLDDDATLVDVQAVGIDAISGVEIIDTGPVMLGVSLEKSTNQLRKNFEDADCVVCKGQANYGTLCDAERGIFFLLCAENNSVAKHLSVDPGSYVFQRHRPPSKSGVMSRMTPKTG